MENVKTEPKLMLYEQTQSGRVLFYILEEEPITFLNTLPPELRICGLKLMASVNSDLIYPEDLGMVATVWDLLEGLQKYPGINIDNLWVDLEHALEISAHDDLEITISFPNELIAFELSRHWLESTGYDAQAVWSVLKKHSKQYVLIEPSSQVDGVFENLDIYLDQKSILLKA